MPDKTQRELIQETHETVIELKTILLGKNSDKGLVGQVDENTKKVNRNTVVIAAVLGSGILGGGVAGLVQLLT